MAANAKRRSGSSSEGAVVRLRPPLLVPASVAEEKALVEALALAMLSLLVSEESTTPTLGLTDGAEAG
jgi:hypothetical protein